jgi:hypothetical protein
MSELNRDQAIKIYKMHALEEINLIKKQACGRKKQISTEYYLDWIMYVLVTGITWENLNVTPLNECLKCSPLSIKQQFYRWNNVNVFTNVNNKLLNIYANNIAIKKLFIDSTDIQNKNGSLKDVGYGKKYKNKLAIRLHSICDENKITFSHILTPANVSDTTQTQNVINNIDIPLKNTYRAPLYVCGDKGYICEKNKQELKRKEYNFNISL